MKRLLWIVAAYIAIVTVASAQSGWYRLNSGVSKLLRDVAFTTTEIGYTVGDGATALRTSDGGITWQQMTLPTDIDSTAEFWRVLFTSPDIGFIFGSTGPLGRYRGAILRTVDRGNTWSLFALDSIVTIFDADFVSSNVGYAVGQAYGMFYKTTNGGETWGSVSIADWKFHAYPSLSFSDEQHGLMIYHAIVPSSQYWGLLRTTDGGTSWDTLDNRLSQEGQLSTVHHLDGATWLIGGLGMLRSDNDGESWQIINNFGTDKFSFFNHISGYSASGSWDNASGHIGKTIDGGRTWNYQQVSLSRIDGVAAPSATIAYAVGANGTILKTTDGGGPTLSVDEPSRPASLSLVVHSNPSARQLQCGFAASGTERQLFVYDLLGRVIRHITIEPEATTTTIATDDFPSGIYWCRLGSETAQTLVVR